MEQGAVTKRRFFAELGAEVYSIERFAELAQQAEETLRQLQYTTVYTRVSNGTLGWEEEAPFDVIIVTARAPQIPKSLLEQLG